MELEAKLKDQIIELLNLEDVNPQDVDNDASLFGDGLGLDSIDALELIVMFDKEYGIKLKDAEEGKQVFQSITTMADYIRAQGKG